MIWSGIAADLIGRHVLDLPHATRALANMAVAMYDSGVACWDAKYTYWSARPITPDPDIKVLFPTPPHPSYPSGHSTVSAAAAVTLASIFPDEESDLLGMATEAAYSRCWAGIHYPSDDDTGTTMGHTVGYMVSEAVRAEVAAGAV